MIYRIQVNGACNEFQAGYSLDLHCIMSMNWVGIELGIEYLEPALRVDYDCYTE